MDGGDKDFVELCRLLDESLDELVGGEQKRSQYAQYNTLQDIHDVVLAYDEEIPAGCASFKEYSPGTAEVKRVFVKEEYRGKGISKQLLELLEEKAKKMGYQKFILETGKQLTAAIGLYRSLGFSVIPNYGQYRNMPNSICMGKTLIDS